MAGPVPMMNPAALPAINPGAGVSAPNPLAQAFAALSSVPAGIDAEKQRKAAAQAQLDDMKLKTQKLKYDQAKTSYDALIQTLPNSPSMQSSPGTISTVNSLRKDMGLPPAPVIDEPVDPNVPAVTRQRLDVNALMPARTLADLTPTEQQLFYALEGPEKVRYAKSVRLNMDPAELAAMPPFYAIGSGQRLQTDKLYQDIIQRVTTGAMTPEQYGQVIEANRTRLKAAQYDPDAMLNDMSVLGTLSQKNQATINNLESLGFKIDAETAAAKTLPELRKAQAKLYGEQANAIPVQLKQAWEGLNIRKQEVAARQQQAHDMLAYKYQALKERPTVDGFNQFKASLDAAHREYETANRDYMSALNLVGKSRGDGTFDPTTPMTQEMVAALTDAKKRRDGLKRMVDQADKDQNDLHKRALSNFTGKPVTGVTDNAPKPPVASKGTLDRAKVIAIGKQNGRSPDQAVREAESQGFTVR